MGSVLRVMKRRRPPMSEPAPSKYCAICKHYDVRGIYMTSCVRCIHWVKDKEDLFEVDVMRIKEAPADE